MRAEIHQLQRRLDVTTIYVTHDQVEAMTMGDRVAGHERRRLQQVDTPQVLYDQPVNEFVAGFIGSPAINLVEASSSRRTASSPSLRRAPPDGRRRGRANRSARRVRRQDVILGIRPEDFEDASLEPDRPPTGAEGDADLTEPLGAEVLVHFTTEATRSSRARPQRTRRGRRGLARRRRRRRASTRLSRASARARDRRGQRDRARGRHEPALLLRPGDRGDAI
jgi:multiple sugar transport system ATP-binding protein